MPTTLVFELLVQRVSAFEKQHTPVGVCHLRQETFLPASNTNERVWRKPRGHFFNRMCREIFESRLYQHQGIGGGNGHKVNDVTLGRLPFRGVHFCDNIPTQATSTKQPLHTVVRSGMVKEAPVEVRRRARNRNTHVWSNLLPQ